MSNGNTLSLMFDLLMKGYHIYLLSSPQSLSRSCRLYPRSHIKKILEPSFSRCEMPKKTFIESQYSQRDMLANPVKVINIGEPTAL